MNWFHVETFFFVSDTTFRFSRLFGTYCERAIKPHTDIQSKTLRSSLVHKYINESDEKLDSNCVVSTHII